MLYNLRAEMARRNITSSDISRVVHKTNRSVRDKIKGKRDFTLTEGTAIRDTFFPNLSLEYLFCKSQNELNNL